MTLPKFIITMERLRVGEHSSGIGYFPKAGATRKREVDALNKIPKALDCDRRIIITYEESDTITDDFGTIEVMPLWKWILGQQKKLKR